MITLKKELAEHLLRNCPARTDEALMSRFGISYNTLRKIESGKPIRASLAQRLEQRLTVELQFRAGRSA
jgi:hypothetical protein